MSEPNITQSFKSAPQFVLGPWPSPLLDISRDGFPYPLVKLGNYPSLINESPRSSSSAPQCSPVSSSPWPGPSVCPVSPSLVNDRALHCTALPCTALHSTALHCISLQHSVALHCNTLHCNKIPCSVLNCTDSNLPLPSAPSIVDTAVNWPNISHLKLAKNGAILLFGKNALPACFHTLLSQPALPAC